LIPTCEKSRLMLNRIKKIMPINLFIKPEI
jgi:hypothetical protein